ncbi:MAG: hypothetical protein V7K47_18295 [Nostoc sp.]
MKQRGLGGLPTLAWLLAPPNALAPHERLLNVDGLSQATAHTREEIE